MKYVMRSSYVSTDLTLLWKKILKFILSPLTIGLSERLCHHFKLMLLSSSLNKVTCICGTESVITFMDYYGPTGKVLIDFNLWHLGSTMSINLMAPVYIRSFVRAESEPFASVSVKALNIQHRHAIMGFLQHWCEWGAPAHAELPNHKTLGWKCWVNHCFKFLPSL